MGFRISRLFSVLAISAGVFLMPPMEADASGSYARRPPRPPSSKKAAMYSLGKAIYNGKADLSAVGDSSAQRSRLEALQGKLPRLIKTKANLPSLAGKLDNDQMEALEHFLAVRYKVR